MKDMHRSKVDCISFLKEKGYKITSARIIILEIFLKNKIPLSANDVFKKITKDKKIKDINEATVYRTISSFENDGILKKIDLRKESTYFELNSDHHHHIVCVKCGNIEDFEESREVEKILNKIIKYSTKFETIKDHSLELFGICKVCK